MAAISANATYFKVNGLWFFTADIDSSVELVSDPDHKYSGTYSGNIVIPSKVTYQRKTYTVNKIGDNAFYDCDKLLSVSLPASLVSIGYYAFTGCSSLTSITIPRLVNTINNNPFGKCSSLQNINVDPENESFSSVDGVLYSSDHTRLISCPGNRLTVSLASGVKLIGDYAFRGCAKLTSISIPNGITNIGDWAFMGCTGLTAIDIPNTVTYIGMSAFEGCTGLKSVNIPNRPIEFSFGTFSDCTSLTSIDLPDSLANIPSAMFSGCRSLKTIDIPKNVTSIEYATFKGCTGLTSINIPDKVTEIGDRAFNECSSLPTLSLPDNLTSIEEYAFNGCKLSMLSIPAKVELVKNMLNGLKVGYLVVNGETSLLSSSASIITDGFRGLEADTIYVPESTVENVTKAWSGTVLPILPFRAEIRGLYPRSLALEVIKTPFWDGDALNRVTIDIASSHSDFTEITPNEDGLYIIAGALEPQRSYEITTFYTTKDEDVDFTNQTVVTPKLMKWSYSSTQTTATLTITPTEDKYFPVKRYGISLSGENIWADKNGKVSLKGLVPNITYPFSYAEETADEIKLSSGYSFDTKDIFITVEPLKITPTTFTGKIVLDAGDATVTDYEMQDYGPTDYDPDDAGILLIGLEPDTSYRYIVYITTKEGGRDGEYFSFSTPRLTLTTLPAKATSNTVALICAETNISDLDTETETGFEWRRYDAPDLVPSTLSSCPVVDGVLTGALRNLSASTYYKFRPYCKTKKGKMYYGDWSAFGTADAYVYFDPTVRTYAATSVNENSAKLRGYAIPGSDDIIEQGFEYWKSGSTVPNAIRIQADENGVQTVTATGQWMSATLSDLTPGTTYSYRAYVKTSHGTTYGDTDEFTTDQLLGIGSAEQPDETARCTVNGLRLTVEGADGQSVYVYTAAGRLTARTARAADRETYELGQPGVYIVRLSDGQSFKVSARRR